MSKNTQPKRYQDIRRYRQISFLLIAMSIVLSGCAAFGPRTVPRDQSNYNKAVADSTRNQMLLNLARIRYLEEPVFLSVSSILTQYVYEGSAGMGSSVDLGGDTDTVAAEANVNYEERPTITYIPMEGREFSERMLSAIPSETMFAAVRYLDYWFYIENDDIDSKRALGLIIALFLVLAPTGGGAAPILTLPMGGR